MREDLYLSSRTAPGALVLHSARLSHFGDAIGGKGSNCRSPQERYYYWVKCYFLPLSSRRISERRTRKKAYPKWKAKCTCLKTRTLQGLRPAAFEAPVAIVLYYQNHDFG